MKQRMDGQTDYCCNISIYLQIKSKDTVFVSKNHTGQTTFDPFQACSITKLKRAQFREPEASLITHYKEPDPQSEEYSEVD